jgi:predicted metal-binding protein
MKCQLGCGGFGQSLTCPPYSPTPEFTRRMLVYYKHALLIHGDAYTNIHKLIPKLERRYSWTDTIRLLEWEPGHAALRKMRQILPPP